MEEINKHLKSFTFTKKSLLLVILIGIVLAFMDIYSLFFTIPIIILVSLLNIYLLGKIYKKYKSKQKIEAQSKAFNSSYFDKYNTIQTDKESICDLRINDKLTISNNSYIIYDKIYGGMGLILHLKSTTAPDIRNPYSKYTLKIPANSSSLKSNDNFRDEIHKWSLMFNKNILLIDEILIHKNEFIVKTKTCKGSLRDILRQSTSMTVSEAKDIVLPIIRALNYAYTEHNILHLDIKPENILYEKNSVNDRYSFLVTDWGISSTKVIDQQITYKKRTQNYNNCGTLPYMAPERLLLNISPSVKSDIYSIGMLLLEIITGKLPYKEGISLPEQIIRGNYLRVAKENLEEVKAKDNVKLVIIRCIDYDYKNRLMDYRSLYTLIEELQKMFNFFKKAKNKNSEDYELLNDLIEKIKKSPSAKKLFYANFHNLIRKRVHTLTVSGHTDKIDKDIWKIIEKEYKEWQKQKNPTVLHFIIESLRIAGLLKRASEIIGKVLKDNNKLHTIDLSWVYLDFALLFDQANQEGTTQFILPLIEKALNEKPPAAATIVANEEDKAYIAFHGWLLSKKYLNKNKEEFFKKKFKSLSPNIDLENNDEVEKYKSSFVNII